MFNCPSDTDRLTNIQGHHNYCGNVGSSANAYYAVVTYVGPFASRRSDGSEKSGRTATFADVIDGLSGTVAFSERVKGIGNNNQGTFDVLKPPATFSQSTLTAGNPQSDYNTCKASPSIPAAQGGKYANGDPSGAFWTNGAPCTNLYCHVMPPNTWSCSTANTWNTWSASTASSRHSGVVNCAMMDGSVRAIKSSISVQVWWALGTMQGAEVVSADSY